jgi:hypothetical protein
MWADEVATRIVPLSRRELEWAQRRPGPCRVATPGVGDTVLYRHEDWGAVVEATVLSVQSLEDINDPNVCRWQQDERGDFVLLDGRPVAVAGFDPWPLLLLQTRFGRISTREARLRGSPGWLPLDWQIRWRPGPHQQEWGHQ